MSEDLDKIHQRQELILSELMKLRKREQEELMSSADVMAFLKISRPTFNRLKNDEIIKVYKLRGGKLLCKKSEILDSLENGLLIKRA